MSAIFDAADALVAKQAELDPISATFDGISGFDELLTDYSPAGYVKRVELSRKYIDILRALPVENERDQITRDVLLERLQLDVEWYNADEYLRDLSFSWSPAQGIRSVFDQMPMDSSSDWERIAKRAAAIPAALAGVQQTLQAGLDKGVVAARRQALACARQARVWAGTDVDGKSFLDHIIDENGDNAKWSRKLEDALRTASAPAAAAFDALSTFLVEQYAPHAAETDAVGRDRYIRAADSYLGMRIDPDEAYQWVWEEIARLDVEIKAVCEQIKPGASLAEVTDLLNNDHERWLSGDEQLVDWLKGLLDRAIKGLDGTVFDIPAQLKEIDVKIAPPGGPANQYYVPPSEDFSRKGAYWYPTDGRSRFPIWTEISTAYHEGVPGHHLQCGFVKVLHHELSRYQRNMFISGHGEGWALYAERLMDEVGYLERPEYRLDMLLNHYFRAARVVVDIGLHLELPIPATEDFHPGEIWTPELAHQFMLAHSNMTDSFIASEILRYLGIPGQAISYKLGEKVWLEARAAAQQAQGESFDLKAWHTKVLSLGPMGLQQLISLSS